MVKVSGPDVDWATGNGHLPIVSDFTGPAKHCNPPGSDSWEFITGVCSCFYNRSTTPLGLPGTDWGGDPPPRTGMRQREKGQALQMRIVFTTILCQPCYKIVVCTFHNLTKIQFGNVIMLYNWKFHDWGSCFLRVGYYHGDASPQENLSWYSVLNFFHNMTIWWFLVPKLVDIEPGLSQLFENVAGVQFFLDTM